MCSATPLLPNARHLAGQGWDSRSSAVGVIAEAEDDSHAALCRELLVLAERGSVVPAERRLQSFAPSSLLSPTEGRV